MTLNQHLERLLVSFRRPDGQQSVTRLGRFLIFVRAPPSVQHGLLPAFTAFDTACPASVTPHRYALLFTRSGKRSVTERRPAVSKEHLPQTNQFKEK
ncbi:hypothetical protein GCM10010215_35610 [Streptomyces virginiae]|uniref:Uncharacterized protein n=1 Tax=Streptomyces virginiae TaxID=1961 RepID=A0ABQ3NPM6_STRVG|nr:hypothetical protein [Streptomyces sp. WAC05950]GGQ07185.1 hypothetical protein GCM10010215_35610 [Streptomyces virginiae]GHI14738.1 hypothetical protein Scinn_42010 [Streptomyces virginiae]GLV92764.1 hypothetical protein Slala04_42180 [Streptomyces lavendulae subsp. lavendulae]